jgi:hypothetical protein
MLRNASMERRAGFGEPARAEGAARRSRNGLLSATRESSRGAIEQWQKLSADAEYLARPPANTAIGLTDSMWRLHLAVRVTDCRT